MKKYITIATAAIAFSAFGLLATSCGLNSSSTHKMGVPGKERSIPDAHMPGMAH